MVPQLGNGLAFSGLVAALRNLRSNFVGRGRQVVVALMITWALAGLIMDGDLSLPIAGTAVLLGALGVFLLFSGGLAELISSTGTFEVDRMPLLTAEEVTLPGRNHPMNNDAVEES